MARPVKLENQLTLAVKDLIRDGRDSADIGVIIGCLGQESALWLTDLKAQCLTTEEFIEAASQRADIALVAAAVEAALGYNYTEVDQFYTKKKGEKNGKPITLDVEGDRKVKTRHAKKNDALLKFILKNRLPEYFQDIQKVEINKKSIEIQQINAGEIKSFAGRLLEAIGEENSSIPK